MASLNTLRTKYGIVLSVVIALVLVAFILGDQLSMRGNGAEIEDNTVLTIDGKNVKQSEYAEYLQKYGNSANPDYSAMTVYQHILFDKYLNPAYEAAGLGFIAEDEDIMFNQYVDDILANDPTALTLSKEEFMQAVESNWNYMTTMNGGIEIPAASTKATAAYAAGKYTNSLEVNEALRNSNLSFDGHYAVLPYTAIACDEATEAEMEAYYNAHLMENPNYGARTLSIVRFDIEASQEDKAAAEAAVMEADAAAKVATDAKGIKSALRGVNGKVEKYVAVNSLTDEEAKAINAGNNYGPVLVDNTWTAKYIVSKVNAPESFTFSAITADSNAAAETLVEEIKAVNGNLAELEAGANAIQKSVKMTELGERDADKLVNAKVGDIFTYTVDNKPAAIVVTELGKNDNFVLTANVNYAVVASNDTHDAVNTKAETLMAEAGNTSESFAEAAMALQAFPTQSVVSRGTDPMQMLPSIRGIEDSRNIAIWAFDAKVGEKKNWTSKGAIYVCMVTAINENKYYPMNEFMVKREVENAKKFEAVKSTLSFETEGVTTGSFNGVTFNSIAAGEAHDLSFVGAIARSTKVGEPAVIKGSNGVYVFVIDNINNNEAVVNADVEAKRKEMNEALKANANMNFMTYMLEGVKISDKRGAGELQ
jgi:peptidyl-prolyl cis-trans isomerase D